MSRGGSGWQGLWQKPAVTSHRFWCLDKELLPQVSDRCSGVRELPGHRCLFNCLDQGWYTLVAVQDVETGQVGEGTANGRGDDPRPCFHLFQSYSTEVLSGSVVWILKEGTPVSSSLWGRPERCNRRGKTISSAWFHPVVGWCLCFWSTVRQIMLRGKPGGESRPTSGRRETGRKD